LKDVEESEKVVYYKPETRMNQRADVQRNDDVMEIISTKSLLNSQEWW